MSATIPLTEAENHDLTIALRLENAGFATAAQWLRNQILVLRGVKWDDSKGEAPIVHDAKAWKALFRAHRGSVTPYSPQPIPIPPSTRDDQVRA